MMITTVKTACHVRKCVQCEMYILLKAIVFVHLITSLHWTLKSA